jgi:hypothetical protein
MRFCSFVLIQKNQKIKALTKKTKITSLNLNLKNSHKIVPSINHHYVIIQHHFDFMVLRAQTVSNF